MNIIEPKLAGLRVLVVEDSFLVAASTAGMLRELGCRVVGPFNNNDDARSALLSGGCDAAVLDINLGRGTSEPIAEVLTRQGLPFLFVTSYTSPPLMNPRFAASPRLQKPISRAALGAALNRSLGERSQGPSETPDEPAPPSAPHA